MDYSDSNRTTPSTSQSHFNNQHDAANIQPSSRSSKQSHVRSPSTTTRTSSSPSDVDDNDIDDDEEEDDDERVTAADQDDDVDDEEADDVANENINEESERSSSQSRSATPDLDDNTNRNVSTKRTATRPSQNVVVHQRQPTSAAPVSSIHYGNKQSSTNVNMLPNAATTPTVAPVMTTTNHHSSSNNHHHNASSSLNQRPIGELGVEAAAAARIKFRRASVNNLVNTFQSSIQQQQQQLQRSIVIRREKSASIQANSKIEGNQASVYKNNKNFRLG